MDRGPTETELKIPTAELGPVQERLRLVGAQQVSPSQREVNVLFDDRQRSLSSCGNALRLRRVGGRWLLTFKGAISYIGQVKQREELQSVVEDGEVMATVFGRLGLHPAMRYEKDREVWNLGQVEVALDHTPMGDFVELEGPITELGAAAHTLGLSPSAAVRGSYVSLWQKFRSDHPERQLPVDMVFADE